MERLQIKENWHELKGKLKHNFRHLTKKDLYYIEGKEDELVERLQRKLGNKKEEVIEIIHRIQSY